MLEFVDDQFSVEPPEEFKSIFIEKMKDIEFALLKIGEWKEMECSFFHLSQGNLMLALLRSGCFLSKNIKLKIDLALRCVESSQKSGINFFKPVR